MLYGEMSPAQVGQMSTLAVAQVGDAVFELMVRTRLCAEPSARAMHLARVRLVNATAQAGMAQRILPLLTEEEQAAYRRGRNAQVGSVPKAATRAAYGAATALETLVGFLYLTGRSARLAELFGVMMDEHP